ncbi:hypothetical protein LG291_22570 [Cytobacillus firmus]|uniref:hypothetical protein n=1 Tax=Cytobacillus firmus TaxID=1399 RepID=UPI00385080CA
MSFFGSVEYFEKEITENLPPEKSVRISEEQFSVIAARLKKELLDDFVCEENIRRECLDNLFYAIKRLKGSKLQTIYEYK